ncbi:MAG: hypothetical protein KatS3mg087_0271 [Patescibacteria group bacterium]|nr:MAG: hypothetical protein KatS3mg087_0271 [Patescibacteria group bacterium]
MNTRILFKVKIKDVPPADTTTINRPCWYQQKLNIPMVLVRMSILAMFMSKTLNPHFLTQGGGETSTPKNGLQRNELPSGQNFIVSTNVRNAGIFKPTRWSPSI